MIKLHVLAIAAAASAGGFHFEQSQDPVTDAVSARAYVAGDHGLLTLKCDQPGPESVYVALVSDEFLGGRGIRFEARAVTVRADSAPAQETTGAYRDKWVILRDQNDHVRPIVTMLTTSRRIIFRLVRYDDRTVDLTFDNMRGAADAVVQVFRACDPEGLNQMMGRKVL